MHPQTIASRAATLLARNPALFCRLILAKLNTARPMPSLPARKRIGQVIFECDLDRYRGTAPMYFGSYALLVVEAMRRYLGPGDVFLDVGANVGYLSAVAADLVGPRGQVHGFEPVPAYFERVQRLAALNPTYSIIANPCAAAETEGRRTIFVTREPGQSTLVPAYKTGREIISSLEVPTIRLDSYLQTRQIGRVALIKIDVEGFELPVLKGLEGYLDGSGHRPAIICEIAPRAYPLLGRSVSELAAHMSKFGYQARDIVDSATPVDLASIRQVEDVLFLAVS